MQVDAETTIAALKAKYRTVLEMPHHYSERGLPDPEILVQVRSML